MLRILSQRCGFSPMWVSIWCDNCCLVEISFCDLKIVDLFFKCGRELTVGELTVWESGNSPTVNSLPHLKKRSTISNHRGKCPGLECPIKRKANLPSRLTMEVKLSMSKKKRKIYFCANLSILSDLFGDGISPTILSLFLINVYFVTQQWNLL